MLVAILLVGGMAGGVLLWDLERRTEALNQAREDVDASVSRLAATLTEIGSAQRTGVALGRIDGPGFERLAALVGQLHADTAAAAARLRTASGSASLKALAEASDVLAAAVARAQDHLRLGQELMAADVILTDGRGAIDAMQARVGDIRAAEQAASGAEYAALATRRWTVLGAAAALWAVGLLLLAFGGRPTPALPAGQTDDSRLLARPPIDAPAPSAPIDLTAAAELCTALSRVTATTALPAMLERAAAILDASGLILWMGAGEELFAVIAHGYPPHLVAQLGAIRRDADNATAAAWRRGAMTTVSPHGSGNGAIVTPMFGPDACVGVLAIELRNRREHDPTTTAVAAMIAAQLAAAVAAWPAASPAGSTEPAADIGAAPTRHVAGA